MSLSQGQCFESLPGFKEALRNWAIVDHFEYRWAFSELSRCQAICVHKDCNFTIRCNNYPQKECAKITVLVPDHTCAGNAPIARSQASRVDWLEQIVPTIMTVDVNTKSRAIVDTINLHYQHRINIQQAQRVRKKLLSLSTERLVADYSQVPAYLKMLHEVSI
jgi:hypothetical protein